MLRDVCIWTVYNTSHYTTGFVWQSIYMSKPSESSLFDNLTYRLQTNSVTCTYNSPGAVRYTCNRYSIHVIKKITGSVVGIFAVWTHMQLDVLAAGQTAYRSIWVHSLVDPYADVKPPIHPAAYVSTLQMCPRHLSLVENGISIGMLRWAKYCYLPCMRQNSKIMACNSANRPSFKKWIHTTGMFG